VMKDPELRDNPPSRAGSAWGYKDMGEFDSQEHLYDKGHPDVHGVFREIRSLLDSYSSEGPRMAVGEIHEFDMPTWTSYYGGALDELHMPFNFGLLRVPWNAASVRRVVDTIEANIPTGAWPNYVLGNHDEHRIASRVGEAQARVAMMLLLTLRGTPTMYYGDEIGMRDVEIPAGLIQDPWGKQVQGLGLGRDPERTPMQWDDSTHAGFCDPDVAPWLPAGETYRTTNVRHEAEDPRSMLNLTRRLLRLRSTEALSAGSYRPVESAEGTFAYIREYGDRCLLVALNFTASDATAPCPGAGQVLLSTHLDSEDRPVEGTVSLRPNEGCVIDLTGASRA
jgi:alpha-glucosidase